MFLLPLMIGIFVSRVEISSWALKSLIELALGILYVFLIVKYISVLDFRIKQ